MTVGSLQHTGDEKGRATLPQHPPQATLTGSMGASHAAPAGHPGPSASTLNGPPPKYTSYRRNQLKLRGKDLADSAKARSARVQNMEKHRWYYLATGAIYIVIASLLMAIAFPDATQFALARLDKDAVLLDGFCSAAMDSTGNKSGCATAQALALANADYDVGASAAIGSFATLYMMHVVAAVMLFVAGIYFVILTWADQGVEVPETDEKGNTKRGRHRKDRTQLKKTVCITTLAVVCSRLGLHKAR
jgi:uncharacterized membrane protein (Fun14 family)